MLEGMVGPADPRIGEGVSPFFASEGMRCLDLEFLRGHEGENRSTPPPGPPARKEFRQRSVQAQREGGEPHAHPGPDSGPPGRRHRNDPPRSCSEVRAHRASAVERHSTGFVAIAKGGGKNVD